MGGWGSGRGTRCARKTNELRSIDLADLKRWGVLGTNGVGSLKWSRGGNVTGEIGYVSSPSGLRLTYRACPAGGAWQEVDEFIPYAFTAQHIGGQRAWFTCLTCRRRARILYGGTRYRCRRCYGAVYESQYEQFPTGKLNAALRIREKLGGPRFSIS